jgi:hypothetical protein
MQLPSTPCNLSHVHTNGSMPGQDHTAGFVHASDNNTCNQPLPGPHTKPQTVQTAVAAHHNCLPSDSPAMHTVHPKLPRQPSAPQVSGKTSQQTSCRHRFNSNQALQLLQAGSTSLHMPLAPKHCHALLYSCLNARSTAAGGLTQPNGHLLQKP